MKLFNLFLITSQPTAATTAPPAGAAATAEETDNGRIARHIIPFLLLGAVIWEGEKDSKWKGEREEKGKVGWMGIGMRVEREKGGGEREDRVFRQDVNIAVAIIFPISFT